MTPENSKTCSAEPGKVSKAKDLKTHQISPTTTKGDWWGIIRTYPWGRRHGDPGLQEECRQVMHQLDAITAAPCHSKTSHPPNQRQESGKLEPSAAYLHVDPMDTSATYLQADNGVRGDWVLNWHWEKLILVAFLPTTIGFQVLQAMLVGLDLQGWLRSSTTP